MLRRVVATAGNPDCGRLGLDQIQGAVEFPQVIKSLLGLQPKTVSAGGAHTAVVNHDGSLFTFGLNNYGQLGHSHESDEVLTPQEVVLPEPAVAIAAGNFHTLCITESGALWSWGRNKRGECGLGDDIESSSEPRLVSSLRNEQIIGVSAGAEHSLAVSKSGELFSWGCGDSGRLGHGSPSALSSWIGRKNEYKPRLVRSLETQKVISVSAGHMHSGCVTDQGQAFVFGSGRFHQLGRISDGDAATPLELKGIPRAVTDIACGGTHTLAVAVGGIVASWGADQSGCLGRSKIKGADIRIPQPIPNLVAEKISAGWKHSAVISPEGKLFTFGWGGSQGDSYTMEQAGGGGGQLFLGNDFDFWAPAAVTHLATSGGGGGGVPQFGDNAGRRLWRVIDVSCGMNHTVAIFELEPEVAL